MRGVRIHAVLLLVALGLAFPSFTRQRTRPTDIQGTLIWDRDSTDIASISYRSPHRQIEITRRADGAETFLWGWEVTSVGGTPAGEPAADTLRFPVGILGSELVKGFSAFRVVREFGQVDADLKMAFGLVDPSAVITVEFGDGSRVIELGAPVYGGSDLYGWDPSTRIAFVLPSELVAPLQTGYGALRERQLHYFQGAEVARVRVQAMGLTREMKRSESAIGTPDIWVPTEDPHRPDPTFANFMERVAQLGIEGFDTQARPEALERILRVEYTDEDGRFLGFVELLKHLDSGAYYLSSERTRVVAEAIGLLAERVEQGLTQIF